MGICGISCEVCGLFQSKICNGCITKEEWQEKKGDACCDIANCAYEKGVKHCSLECTQYPCDVYQMGYPFSDTYLKMYQERKEQKQSSHKGGR